MLFTFSLPFSGSDLPSLAMLIELPCKGGGSIKTVRQCSSKYYDIGVFLLNDNNADMVKSLETEHQRNADRIMKEVFKSWIDGAGKKPTTWNTIIAVLRNVELGTLADMLQDAISS